MILTIHVYALQKPHGLHLRHLVALPHLRRAPVDHTTHWARTMTVSHTKRNTLICTAYASGTTVPVLCRMFNLGPQRVKQILQRGGVWQPRKKTDRTEFLGIVTDKNTKRDLKANANALGISVSDYTTRKLKEMLNGAE